MALGLVLLAVALLGILGGAIIWTVRLVNTVPSIHDMMPLLPREQFFIAFSKRRSTAQ